MTKASFTRSSGTISPARAVVGGALAAAALDGLESTLAFGALGVPPARVFQGIAAGLLGREAARAGGAATVLLGVALLVGICAAIVAVYLAASRYLPRLVQRWWLWGPLYGGSVFVVMQYVVVPLSAAAGRTPSPWALVNCLAANVLLIGPTAALAARAARRRDRAEVRAEREEAVAGPGSPSVSRTHYASPGVVAPRRSAA